MRVRHPSVVLATALALLTVAFPAWAGQQAEVAGVPSVVHVADPVGDYSWGIAPAGADGKPDQRVSFRLRLDPGAVITEHALVTNYSGSTLTFDILASDGVISADGSFDILRSDQKPVDVGRWIKVQPTVEIAAGASAVVPFTITVPDNATPGDHPGGIVAGLTQTGKATGGPQVGLDTRVGVRIHLRISGAIHPVVSYKGIATSYEPSLNPFAPGRLHLRYTVTNEGNVRLGSIQQADVSGPFGLSTGAAGPSGTVVGKQREILPGESANVSTVFESTWPLGPITTKLLASQDSVGDDPPLGKLDEVTASTTVWAVPWMQLVLLVLVVLLVLGVVWLLRRRRTQHADAIARARAEGAREAALGNRPVVGEGRADAT